MRPSLGLTRFDEYCNLAGSVMIKQMIKTFATRYHMNKCIFLQPFYLGHLHTIPFPTTGIKSRTAFLPLPHIGCTFLFHHR